MSLPTPEPLALAHSETLCAAIKAEIGQSHGWISFARFMDKALYEPGLGYYSGGAQKFGAAGDFVTAPEISPLFGQTLAQQVAEIMALSSPHIIEAGAGSGALAVAMLAELETMGCPPETYAILELSGELRQRQQDAIAQKLPHLASRVTWLDGLPESFSGAIIGNEVLDAMPVHLVHWTAEGVQERGVALDEDGRFTWADRPADEALRRAAYLLPVAPDYLSEINLMARVWVEEWARILKKGALLLIDYGFPEQEYYHPQRAMGTLMCHYRHHAHDEPFHLPGLEDITAHVDFTAITIAGTEAGLDLLGYTSQGQFLLNCGLTEMLARHSPDEIAHFLPLSVGVQKLINPSEMGELFKVIALGRGLDVLLRGFQRGDRCHTL